MSQEIEITRKGKAVVEGEYCGGDCEELCLNKPYGIPHYWSCNFWSGHPLGEMQHKPKRCPECLACDQPQSPQWKDAPDKEGWWMLYQHQGDKTGYLRGSNYLEPRHLKHATKVWPNCSWYGPIEPPSENDR